MNVTELRDSPVLWEEIAPRGPAALARLRKLRSDLSTLLIGGALISAAIRLALLG